MVGKTNYSSVPTVADLENNSNSKKYTVNRKPGGVVISKPLCALMAIGALLLAILVGLVVFFLVPRCSEASPESLTSKDGFASDFNAPDAKQIDERLPRSIEPTHYSLRIMPFLNNLTTHGEITITLNIQEDTKEIIFNVKDIEIDQSSLRIKSVKSDAPLEVTSQEYVEGERYRIILGETLTKNIMYSLRVLFVGHLNKHLQGFYRSEYEDIDGNTYRTKYLASTQFSPTDARRAFPCFDEPSFKAIFSISIARPSNTTAISNMRLEKSDVDQTNKGVIWDYFEETPKMSTYLTAFVVSDLQAYGADKLIKIWTRRSLIHQTRYASEFAPKVLRFFEDYFNIKFPLPKIDIVAIPDFGFNAMENWGLITFRESSLLFDEQQSDIDNKRDIATILSHELGHQWFGNLVTPKWWNDLWLKEGFATYLQYFGANYAEPSWKINEEFILSETIRAFDLDALESSRPISFDVKNSQQIRQTFDELSYGKGACLIRMMNHFLGEEIFKRGLIKFLHKFQYGNADQNDLFGVLTEEAHETGALDKSLSVREIMDSWTKQPGFPVINVFADRQRRKLDISQKRFLFTSSKNDSKTWWVPLSITSDINPDFESTKPTVWLKHEPTVSVDLNFNRWYIINVNQTGYFIVNYDEETWNALGEEIMTLPPSIRAQLISDSMNLAKANLLDYSVPLKMISRMATRDGLIMFVPTSVAFKKLEYLSDMLATSPAYGLFEEFQSTIFKNTYRSVDSDVDFYANDYLKQRIRKAVLKWACRRTDGECAIRSHHMFRGWMEKNNLVPPNLRDVVYCTAIRQGTEAEWNFAYDQYQSSTSVSERNVLLDALGCTTKKWLLSRYLELLARNETSIRIQDADRVFKSVSDNSIANTMAFDFLRTNWNKLQEHYGEGFNIISKMVKNLPRYMNTEYQLNELIRFRSEIRDSIGATSQAFDSAIERVRGNVEWMKKNYHSVERWFNDYKQKYNLF